MYMKRLMIMKAYLSDKREFFPFFFLGCFPILRAVSYQNRTSLTKLQKEKFHLWTEPIRSIYLTKTNGCAIRYFSKSFDRTFHSLRIRSETPKRQSVAP